MYHSIRMAVNIWARQLRPNTAGPGTCDANHHHGVEFPHRARTGIREYSEDMRARSEPELWLYKSLESSNLMSDALDHAGGREERRVPSRTMCWPCNHYWGKWACNRWVNTMGAKCQDCKNRKDMDSTPTHTRLAHMYDVDVIVEGFRNAGLNAACVVEMMSDGASERALQDALRVIRENDVAWHDRVEHVVLLGIIRWKNSKTKAWWV
ncbi:hypothetical protein FDECE_14691 [Fusarium decemcellulare]|nr:hypothetical protein FDECE_14691 [Fusarium decemcellulare]